MSPERRGFLPMHERTAGLRAERNSTGTNPAELQGPNQNSMEGASIDSTSDDLATPEQITRYQQQVQNEIKQKLPHEEDSSILSSNPIDSLKSGYRPDLDSLEMQKQRQSMFRDSKGREHSKKREAIAERILPEGDPLIKEDISSIDTHYTEDSDEMALQRMRMFDDSADVRKKTRQKLQTEHRAQEDEKLFLKKQAETQEQERALVRKKREDSVLSQDMSLSAETLERVILNIQDLIKKIGRNTLIDEYKIPGILTKKWEQFSQPQLIEFYNRLLKIQTEETVKKSEITHFYKQAEEDRNESVKQEKERAEKKKADQTSVVKQTSEPRKPGPSIIVKDLNTMNRQVENAEAEDYVKAHFDKPVEESERLSEKEPKITIQNITPEGQEKRGSFFGQFLRSREQQKQEVQNQRDQEIVKQWQEQIPRMSLDALRVNAKQAFDIDFADQSADGLKKVTELLNSRTSRGEIFTMLYNKFVEIRTGQKRDEETKARRTEIAKGEIQKAENEMRLLIDRVGKNLTWPQQQEMQQIYRDRAQAQAQGDLPKVLEVTEHATNTLRRFERLYKELKKSGGLKTSTPPITKPPGLLSRIGSILGFGRK